MAHRAKVLAPAPLMLEGPALRNRLRPARAAFLRGEPADSLQTVFSPALMRAPCCIGPPCKRLRKEGKHVGSTRSSLHH